MTVPEVDRVVFVGAGTMGAANSLVAAVAGYEVVLHDAGKEALASVGARHDEVGAFLVAAGHCTDDGLRAARTRVSLAADLVDAVAGADLISESVFEDLDLKRDVHRRLDATAPPHAIQTTNTSSFVVSEIEDVVERGDRFAALHSHLGSPLFDIVGGPRTGPTTLDVLRRYVRSVGGVPLVLDREHPGYVFNALNGAVLAMALRLVLDERADLEAVDRAWMVDRGAPLGPFGMMDLFGLDLVLAAWRRPSHERHREELRPRAEALLGELVEQGRLGQKSGRGFYRHPDPAYLAPGFLEAADVSAAAADALRTALLAAAVELAAGDVATTDDIDLAWTVATGLDAGPFALIDQSGLDAVLATLGEQVTAGLFPPETARMTEEWLLAER